MLRHFNAAPLLDRQRSRDGMRQLRQRSRDGMRQLRQPFARWHASTSSTVHAICVNFVNFEAVPPSETRQNRSWLALGDTAASVHRAPQRVIPGSKSLLAKPLPAVYQARQATGGHRAALGVYAPASRLSRVFVRACSEVQGLKHGNA
ncbi:hypothetical protein [Sphingomonas sp. LM7]|uniref:hypothetical protein n=1 Tax=Sphingomonas sp. LM7 TaxID=1938607 RepID=UPI0015C56CFB|nr:hypothetical protein [Sphingomonas sp. LM7]